MIEKIVLTPKDSEAELSIDLHGDLADILQIASEDKSMKAKGKIEKRLEAMAVNGNDNFEPSVQLVAGARNQLILLFQAIDLPLLRKNPVTP